MGLQMDFSPPSPPPPHHQLLDAKTTFVDSVGWWGRGEGWGVSVL